MKTLNVILIILGAAIIAGCAEPNYVPTKTALELQAIQTKEFESTKQQAFAATLSVFQDLGYSVSSASFETGLIAAKSPTNQEFVPFVGQRMKDRRATAFVEEIVSGRTKVRLSFVDNTQTSSGYGMRTERDMPIETPQIYQDTFVKIQQGIFIRKNAQ